MTMLSAPSPSTWISMPLTESRLLIAAEILGSLPQPGQPCGLVGEGLDLVAAVHGHVFDELEHRISCCAEKGETQRGLVDAERRRFFGVPEGRRGVVAVVGVADVEKHQPDLAFRGQLPDLAQHLGSRAVFHDAAISHANQPVLHRDLDVRGHQPPKALKRSATAARWARSASIRAMRAASRPRSASMTSSWEATPFW